MQFGNNVHPQWNDRHYHVGSRFTPAPQRQQMEQELMTTVPLAELNERAWARSKEQPAQALAVAREAEAEARRINDEISSGRP